MSRWMFAAVAIAALIGAALFWWRGTPPETIRVEPLLLREAKAVAIDGRTEEWRLVWRATPAPVCSQDDVESAVTCPCYGIAYGEYGHLAVQRWQAARMVDGLDLGPLYGEFDGPGGIPAGMIPLRRKPLEYPRDSELASASPQRLVTELANRPVAAVIQFADYDHDGVAAEFLLNVGTLPCGKLQFVAVGISRADSRLHAFGSAAHPDRPLVMPRHAWDALLETGRGSGSLPGSATTICPSSTPSWSCPRRTAGSARRPFPSLVRSMRAIGRARWKLSERQLSARRTHCQLAGSLASPLPR
jgi:hypothetical protein